MNTVKIDWTSDWGLSEIYEGGLQMALCSPPNAEGVHSKSTTFVTCKDFFQDAVQAFHLGVEKKIYKFKYNPKTDPALSFDRSRILIGNNLDKDFPTKIPAVVDFVNQFEKKIHLIRTKAFLCEPTPEKWEKSGGVYLFEGSGRWMTAPPMISLYCLLLRCGFLHTVGQDFDVTCDGIMNSKIPLLGDKKKRQSGCNDDTYLKQGQPGIKAILQHGYAKLFYKDSKNNFKDCIDIHSMHDSCGIVGFSTKQVEELMPYWFRLLNPKKVVKKKLVKEV